MPSPLFPPPLPPLPLDQNFTLKLYKLCNRSLYPRDTPNSWPVGLRVIVHTQPLNALEGVICEVELGQLPIFSLLTPLRCVNTALVS
jgi:hypothetical protein